MTITISQEAVDFLKSTLSQITVNASHPEALQIVSATNEILSALNTLESSDNSVESKAN